jgi:dihydroneopterin aldolase
VTPDAGGLGAQGLCIELRGLRVVAIHGVLEEERTRPQPFLVDLDVWIDPTAAMTDSLDDTIDYAAVLACANEVMTARSFQLLEAAAAAIGDAVLASDTRANAVGVRVSKVRPPVPFDVDSVAVHLVRQRAQS